MGAAGQFEVLQGGKQLGELGVGKVCIICNIIIIMMITTIKTIITIRGCMHRAVCMHGS